LKRLSYIVFIINPRINPWVTGKRGNFYNCFNSLLFYFT